MYLGISETSPPPPDGYLPMKPGYTYSNNYVNGMTMEGQCVSSKHGNFF